MAQMRDNLDLVARPVGVLETHVDNELDWLPPQSAHEIPSEPAPVLANRSEDGRLMYYEHQLQRADTYHGFLDEKPIPIEELRVLFAELADYFGIFSLWHFQLPPAGLPGFLNEPYGEDDPEAKLLRLGMRYAHAIIGNERRAMHLRWRDASEIIRKIRWRAREEAEERILNEQAQQMGEAAAKRGSAEVGSQDVYFIASASGPIKIGIVINPQNRLRGLQTGHHEKLELLATCAGGADQERAYHELFAAHRLQGEWFERSPAILAEIERLQKGPQ